MAGADHETRAEVELVESIWRDRGADGKARGMTRADAVLVLVSVDAVLVTVTIFASYRRDGSRFVKLALRVRVVSVLTIGDEYAMNIGGVELEPASTLSDFTDCTVTGAPKRPPRSRIETSY